MVLSDKSIQIAEAFPSDLISFTLFEIKKKPKVIQAEETLEDKYIEKIGLLKKGIEKKKVTVDVKI